jgi:uncharacterized protein
MGLQDSSLRQALLNPEIYPDHPEDIRLIETHISLLFLTGKYVYKVKKPVDFGFLDFTSLEKRKYFCEEEVRLNRRLSPGMYLGVVGITSEQGQFSIEGRGEVIEYAVKMNQIPEDHLMDRLLEKNRVTGEMIEAVSDKLADFYSSAETSNRIKSFAKPERVRQDTDENFDQTRKYIGVTISKEVYEGVKNKTSRFLEKKKGVFYERIAEDRIRDCHGDLRLEHIFLGDGIFIFDCIEFNERFRYTDVAADIAFLAMDLDYHGREDLSGRLIEAYLQKSGDRGVLNMLDFYKCYRAYVRGKVESFGLDDTNFPERKKAEARKRAQKYFELSFRYSQRF